MKWEIWGRRTPFFYREQIGDDILLDNGKKRAHFVPPTPAKSIFGRLKGFALIQRSLGANTATLSDARAGFMAGIGSDPTRWRTDGIEDNQRVLTSTMTYMMRTKYLRETTQLFLSPWKSLPQRYRVVQVETTTHYKPIGKEEVRAELDAKYDVAIPTGLDTFPAPTAETPVYDMTATCIAPEAQGENVTQSNGLTVTATAKIRDSEGCLLVNLAYWLGDTKLVAQTGDGFGVDLSIPQGATLGVDNLGRHYTKLHRIYYDQTQLYLCPEEPYKPGEPHPTHITLTLPIQLSKYERMGTSGQSAKLLAEDMTMRVALPTQEGDLGWDNSDELRNAQAFRFDFAATKASMRAQMYSQRLWRITAEGKQTFVDPLPREKPEERARRIKRHVYWLRKTADATDRLRGGAVWSRRLRQSAERREQRQ
ncbi:MAG: hypothetical protein QM758_14600 [Armatimonas sp.]